MGLACYADGDIYIVSLGGTGPIQVTSITQGAQLCAFDLSPDGEHIVYVEENPALSESRDLNIYRVDVNGTGLLQLATLPAVSYCGSVQWSPNGEEVFVTTSYDSVVSASDLFLIGTEEGEVHSIFHSNHHIFTTPRWLVGGQHIFFVEYVRERDANAFYIVDRNGIARTFEITGLGSSIFAGDLSQDQTQFVFALMFRNEADPGGLYVADLETGYWAHILTDYQVSFDGIATLVSSDWR
jgi:WD40 repeat protein